MKSAGNPPKPIRKTEPLNEREEQIRRRAYELYEQRGKEHGHAVEDWLQAEQEVMLADVQVVAA